jgi:transglutaminase-like putative cysteine protease
MLLSAGCKLAYEVSASRAHFTFNLLANADAHQRVVSEELICVPEAVVERIVSSKGNRVLRVSAPTGPFEVRYTAAVAINRAEPPAETKPEFPGSLPLSVLTYLLPSRYCESDRLTPNAWELFGKIENPAAQVRAICLWVDQQLAYKPGATDSRTSAWDVWQQRKGVCRDYAHLAIALCRALSIPARYVSAYAVGLDPMDFHACFEAHLGGHWYLFDPSDSLPPGQVAVIARGRDAANAAVATIFGQVRERGVTVTCQAAPSAPETAAPLLKAGSAA